jgi:hypothetical protein
MTCGLYRRYGFNVEFIDFGIGFKNMNTVYINRKLLEPEWNKLFEYVLEHESKHTSKTFSFEDIYNDFRSHPPSFYKFLWNNPRELFYMFSPVFKLNNSWQFNPVMIFEWILILIIVGVML